MQCKEQWNISLPLANTIHEMVFGKGALPWWGRWFEVDIVVAYKKGKPSLSWIRKQEFYYLDGHELHKGYYTNMTCTGQQQWTSTILTAH